MFRFNSSERRPNVRPSQAHPQCNGLLSPHSSGTDDSSGAPFHSDKESFYSIPDREQPELWTVAASSSSISPDERTPLYAVTGTGLSSQTPRARRFLRTRPSCGGSGSRPIAYMDRFCRLPTVSRNWPGTTLRQNQIAIAAAWPLRSPGRQGQTGSTWYHSIRPVSERPGPDRPSRYRDSERRGSLDPLLPSTEKWTSIFFARLSNQADAERNSRGTYVLNMAPGIP